MSNIIDELYLGNINPNELMEINNPCYSKYKKQACALSKKLEMLLNPEEKKLFHMYLNASSSMVALEVRLRFIEGFRLGAKIMLDVLTSSNPNISLDPMLWEQYGQENERI